MMQEIIIKTSKPKILILPLVIVREEKIKIEPGDPPRVGQ